MQLLVAAALVTIRIYNYAAIPPADISEARAAATRIFHGAGIDLVWLECKVPGHKAGAACMDVLGESEFVLRLIKSETTPQTQRVTLGSSLVDRETGGVLITIDAALISAIARDAAIDRDLVLGRAIAHEVGHLLLGMPGHARSGLMRAVWSQRELRENRGVDWCFSASEAKSMRQTLAARSRAAN